jgi:tetratricopeptide (TPR) repeat protein
LPQNIAVETSVDVPLPQARAVLAEMLLAAGELERAATIYTELARESPRDAGAYAALGAIAVGQGDRQRALEQWKLAVALGIQDAPLCYQYALLGEQAGIPEEELRPALERALALKPAFDDARYLLAIMEKNAGQYAAAVLQLRAMRTVPPARAYNYWMTMADAFLQLDRREDARNASARAMEYAATAAEHGRAAQLAYLAETDFAVQYAIGQNGRAELHSTRVPHATADFNPFIEPGDKIRHVAGALLAIDCSGSVTRFVVSTAEGRLTLAIPDPGRVQMRNAPSEFTCGPQKSTKVVVDYAVVDRANGLVRGMQFTEPRP